MGEMNFKQSLKKAAKGLWMAFPMILGTILLVSLISAVVPKTFYISFFGKNTIFNSFVGSLIGSISAGNPLTSYIFGGEMLIQGVGLVGVTAFLVCWVTVGLVQLPAESMILGRKFAILRNLTAFFLSIVVAIITVFLLEVIV
jgi:uncharacterized membrane protein YraQ (UPF0718 family)